MMWSFITGLPSSLENYVSNLLQQKIQEQAACYFLYESNVEKLEQTVGDLQNKRVIVKRRVDEASRNGKEPLPNVQNWLNDVNDIIAENNKFWEDKDLPYTVYSKHFLPKPGTRYRLARRAFGLVRKVENLCKDDFDAVSSGLRAMSANFILFDNGFESFDSRSTVTKKIKDVLKDPAIRMIGLYGPEGVGKTALVKRVAFEALKDKLFEEVYFANVTRNPDVEKIQGELTDQLCSKFDEQSDIGRGNRLRDIFKEKKNTLVILDDIWAKLDLKLLGISIDDLNEGMGDSKMFKIVMTSRNQEVLCNEMNVKENSSFSIGRLEEKDAETLFKNVVGPADNHLEFEQLTAQISKKCGGIPKEVVTIGKKLRNKNCSEWKDELTQLEVRDFTGVVESIATDLNFGEKEDFKSTFLLCAQLGHDPLFMDLMKYCIALGIFEGFHTIEETREGILGLITKHKNSSLLFKSYSDDHFNMHDMIHDVVLLIASKEQHLFTMRNEKLHEWPPENEFKVHNAIFIHNCDINDQLPNSVSCPRLKIFHVDSLDPSFNVPKTFFEGMRELRALILTGIDLSNSPTSIRCLRNLRMLCLERCILCDISFIGEMEKLKILSLSRSIIENLPTELGHLHKLQLLDISNCFELREIPPNVLSNLNDLEELYMRNSVNWNNDGNQGAKAILDELRCLHRLKNLEICIPSAAVYPSNLFLDTLLDRYKIIIGDFETLSVGDSKLPDKYEASRVLALQIKQNLIHSSIKMLFKRVEKLLLGELKGVQDICFQLDVEGFPCLKQLAIVNNSETESIINSKKFTDPKDAFPILESLFLFKLKKMKKISSGMLTGTCFSNLKVIKIEICAQLESIFSLSMVKFLINLEAIDVSNCDSLENIVAKEEHNMDITFDKMLLKVSSLALRILPKFSGFDYSNDQGRSADICLFNDQVAIPKLESLQLDQIKVHKIWSSQSKSFGNLIKLNVENCEEIKYLFSFSMAKSLENLKSISVSRCWNMVEIFKYEVNIMNEAKKVRVLPRLEEIHLTYMGNLTDIWPTEVSLDSFPCLNSVFIKMCNELVKVLPSHMMRRFGRLESLKVVDCDQVDVIFDLDGAENSNVEDETLLQVLKIQNLQRLEHVWNKDPKGILSFKRLHTIEVTQCENLNYLFPVSVAKGLQELDCLNVSNCPCMEEIASNASEEGLNESSVTTFEFPKVTLLAMNILPELKSFCKGRYILMWPKLRTLSLNGCDELKVFETETTNSEGSVFLPEKAILNLEAMAITVNEAEWLQQRIQNYRMNCMNILTLISCCSVESLNWFLDRMPKLERLTLFSCDLSELILSGSLETRANIGSVVVLKVLELLDLESLENIGFDRDPILQRLEGLYVTRCHALINLAPPSVTFTHLTSLEVHECQGLKNLMGFSTAKGLVRLMSLKVIECQELEEIVAEESDTVKITYNHEIVFSKLMTLEIVDLPNLLCFCSSKIRAFKFPSLEKLILRDCPKMRKFSMRVTLNLQVLEREEEWHWKGDLNAAILKKFMATLPFQSEEHLRLSNYAELEYILHGKIPLPDNSFLRLRTLVVENCEFLSTVIPSNLLPYFENLEELEVRTCMSVVAIFEVNDKVKVESTRLKKVNLDQLPNMKHVWNKNLQGILSFENLQELQVTGCDCLETVFPTASFTKTLSKLETLEIKNCKALVEIVGKVEASDEGAIQEVEFLDLNSLTLDVLPKLKYFYSGRMKLRCPRLKVLNVYHCGKLTRSQIFTSKSQSYHGAVAEDHIGSSNDWQSLFSMQEVISSLKELSLTKEEAKMLCTAGIPAHLLSKLKLKCLRLRYIHYDTDARELLFEILPKLPKMETLAVACSDFNDIFPKKLAHGFPEIRLKGLRLEDLYNLKSIGLEHPLLDSLTKKLEELCVERCPLLTKLVQSPVSFSSLRELVISECHGLEYLFNSRSARCLERLGSLSVEKCESIKQIVVQEEDGVVGSYTEVLFQGLSKINLDSLPSLECFYATSSTLTFPYLRELKIDECPNMTFFSQGSIYAPSMPERDIPTSLSEDDWRLGRS